MRAPWETAEPFLFCASPPARSCCRAAGGRNRDRPGLFRGTGTLAVGPTGILPVEYTERHGCPPAPKSALRMDSSHALASTLPLRLPVNLQSDLCHGMASGKRD